MPRPLAIAGALLLALVAGATGCAPASRGGGASPHEVGRSTHAVPGADRPLDASEKARLARGETIVREHTIDEAEHRWVGGVTYTLIDGPPGQLLALFDDMDAYRRVLPKTRQAKLVGRDGDDRLVELVQGNALVSAEYTIRVRIDDAAHEARFWLEPSRPHSIDDAWGFFRLSPFVSERGEPGVLLTYGVMVDVGPGLVRELFEEKVRAAMLGVPQQVRRYFVEGRRALR
ncbi:MAG: hypothetical protein JST00_29420 [Deltaproteobacteria bacterium]|nr:hypothetical protein [Deltaproteobacteria bacterium]